jgi:putative oxidoreductase
MRCRRGGEGCGAAGSSAGEAGPSFDIGKPAAFKRGLDASAAIAQPAHVNFLGKYSGWAYAVMRIIVGLLFATHGAQKAFGMFGGKVATAPQMIFAGWVELVTGLLIAIGLLTRPAAFMASGVMAAAYFMAHAGQGWHPVLNKGELAVVYCFLFLYMFFRGAGPLSADSLIFKGDATASRLD